MTAANHDRPCYAKYLAAGADQSSSVARSHEEPDSAYQDCEAHQCWYYQDPVRRARGVAYMVCVGSPVIWQIYEVSNGEGTDEKGVESFSNQL